MSASRDVLASDIRVWWFSSIYDLSDTNLQHRTWLDPTNRNPHWSYVEFVCSYPDDDQLLHAHQRGWLAADEFAIMRDLRRTLIAYAPPGNDHYDHVAILDDPGWHAVIEAAGQAKRKLLSQMISERERSALSGKLS
jgi:hypothetical protein